MKTIAILQQKGGSGKTTISLNLSHAFALNGLRVVLADADKQRSARDWYEVAEERPFTVQGRDTAAELKDLHTQAALFDLAIIDGAPKTDPLQAIAARIADLVLIPVQPSPFDVWACAELVDVVKTVQEARGGKPGAAFVISRAIQGTKISSEVLEPLESFGFPVLDARTVQRVAYATTAAEGRTVFALPDEPAAREIEAIRATVADMMQ